LTHDYGYNLCSIRVNILCSILTTYAITRTVYFLEAYRLPFSQQISQLSWNQNINKHVHMGSSPVPISNHNNRIHTLQNCLSKNHYNVIFPSAFACHFVPHQHILTSIFSRPSRILMRFCRLFRSPFLLFLLFLIQRCFRD
jgi:hypothetical protein